LEEEGEHVRGRGREGETKELGRRVRREGSRNVERALGRMRTCRRAAMHEWIARR